MTLIVLNISLRESRLRKQYRMTLIALLCKIKIELNPFQSGFVGHSTTTALINVTDDIRLGMEKGNLTVLCFYSCI